MPDRCMFSNTPFLPSLHFSAAAICDQRQRTCNHLSLSMSILNNANNTHINGPARFVHNENHYHSDSGVGTLDDGIRLLDSRVVKGAMHNSGERFDAPTCHEDTRTAIQDDILGWADELVNDLNELVTWLHGPAGAGKSAIAQTIAQKLDARGRLTASFFFSRAGGSVGRGAETDFVATIAYQLSRSVPATKPHIAAAVREDRMVFDLTLQDQVDRLIVAPLIAVSTQPSEPSQPGIIVVDGLDECRQENNAQKRVVDALISGLCRIPHHTQKLFITSRPEDRIVAIFEKYEWKLLRRMQLDDKWNPDRDIRAFVNASFADIRRSHFYFRHHPVDETWPEPNAINRLVWKSSGQFIYASVVLKYIKSHENYSPVTRLETILNLDNNSDQPYAELDALYEHVFSQIPDTDILRVLTILHLDQMFASEDLELPLETFLPEFMGMHMNEIKFCLLPLASLLTLKEWGSEWGVGHLNDISIHYMHTSLVDFLQDQSRSKLFCINTPTMAAGIVHRAIEMIEDGPGLLTASAIGLLASLFEAPMLSRLLTIPRDYADTTQSEQRFKIYALLSNFNVVETVLCMLDVDFVDIWLAAILSDYIGWILHESKDENASYYLSKPAAQIQTWLFNQIEHLRFNNVDNTEQIDLRTFLGWSKNSDLSENFSSALEICRSSPTWHQLQHGIINLSSQAAVLCCIRKTRIGRDDDAELWESRPDLLGQYAMAKEHYAVALQHIAYYLLQLPKQTLLDIFKHSNTQLNIHKTPIMRLIKQVSQASLRSSPPTTDLYFLVALIYPILNNIYLGWGILHQQVWDYLSKY
ncbi:hypothetical protein D9619_004962 [Psilocybe cf. subviscida]|uniref:Nephrocystin 3-like N-terminal domain-containing protein n=1 Tax=Psilocybe cf. subviscida TaxID=2480587 RepID=A0A8H5BRG2_9AGAR|nr:hypothetical protein D9619_004962 [Psilocybe cf. subviscida]